MRTVKITVTNDSGSEDRADMIHVTEHAATAETPGLLATPLLPGQSQEFEVDHRKFLTIKIVDD